MFPNKRVEFLVSLVLVVMVIGSCSLSSYVSRPSSPRVGKVEYVPGEILVKFKQGVSQRKIHSLNALHQGGVLRKIPTTKVFRLKLKGFSFDIPLKMI